MRNFRLPGTGVCIAPVLKGMVGYNFLLTFQCVWLTHSRTWQCHADMACKQWMG